MLSIGCVLQWRERPSIESLCRIVPCTDSKSERTRRKQWNIAPNHGHRSSSQYPVRMVNYLTLLYGYLLISSTTKSLLSLNGPVSQFVEAQTNMDSSSSDLCELTIWVYSDDLTCKSLNPPSGVGSIIADNTCRTVEIDSSQTSDPSVYNLFPGTYRAQCTSDAKSVHFFESGCKYSNCASKTVGSNVCQRDITLPSSLYSRRANPEYEVQQIADMTTSTLSRCSHLTDGYRSNVSFMIFGDCNNPACTRLETFSPAPTVTPTSPNLSPVNSNVEGSMAVPSTLPTAAQDDYQTNAPSTDISMARTETIRTGMVLSEIDGSLSKTDVDVWKNITTSHLYEMAKQEGYNVFKIRIKQIQIERLNMDGSSSIIFSSGKSVPPQKFRFYRYRKLVGSVPTTKEINKEQQQTRQLESSNNSTHSVRFVFDVAMTIPLPTSKSTHAAQIFSESFDDESERSRYIIQLSSSGIDDESSVAFNNVTQIQILSTASVSSSSSSPPTQAIYSNSWGRKNEVAVIVGSVLGGILLAVVGGYFVYQRGRMSAANEHTATRTVATFAESTVAEIARTEFDNGTTLPSIADATSSTAQATVTSLSYQERKRQSVRSGIDL